MNWNSKQKEYTKLVKIETIATAEHCKHLKSIGHSVADIADKLNLSKAKIGRAHV